MNSRLPLFASPALFLLGLFLGREFFPASEDLPEPNPPESSSRTPRSRPSLTRPPSEATVQLATDIAGLLAQVDPRSPFTTSTRLRAALGGMSPGQLTSLFHELQRDSQGDPGFQTLRLSLLNHLIASDPGQALDLVLTHEDSQFRITSISLVMRELLRRAPGTAREALARIDDAQLKAVAENILREPSPDLSSEELLALLNAGSKPQYTSFPFHQTWEFGSWGSYDAGTYLTLPNPDSDALGLLARKDLMAAENHAFGLKTVAEQASALVRIATGLAQDDPDQALAWARRQNLPGARDQALAGIIHTIAADDPARAASLLGEIAETPHYASSIASVANQWAVQDPQAALAWVESLPPSATRINAKVAALNHMSQKHPQEALQLALALPGQTGRNLISNLLNQWTARDFESARDWVTSQADPVQLQQGLSSLINPWVQRDPAGAAAFLAQSLAEQPGSPALQNQVHGLARQWSTQDREAAMSWARSLEDDTQRNNAFNGIHAQWAESDPVGAARHLTSVDDSGQRQQLLHSIASKWMSQEPEAAQRWLDSLPAEDRFTAGNAALSSIRQQDPARAAALFDRLTAQADGDQQKLSSVSHYASDIANQWALHSPREAAAWAAELPEMQHQADAYGRIADRWVEFDPAGTAQWIDTLPQGKPRDEATHQLVYSIRQSEPATAFEWAATISDENTRFRSVRDSLQQWSQTDPEAAREAARSADLPPDRRDDLLRQLR